MDFLKVQKLYRLYFIYSFNLNIIIGIIHNNLFTNKNVQTTFIQILTLQTQPLNH
jgi:hypothetical protein